MDRKASIEFFEHFRMIAKRQQASGCPSCRYEGQMLEKQVDEMEAQFDPSSDKHDKGL